MNGRIRRRRRRSRRSYRTRSIITFNGSSRSSIKIIMIRLGAETEASKKQPIAEPAVRRMN